MPFVKGMLHSVDLKNWFNQYKKDYIIDVFGIKRKTSEIKILLTKSQFKCYKWIKDIYKKPTPLPFNNEMDYYFHFFNKYNHSLYITDTDKLYPSNETVLNYQVLHTPTIHKSDFNKLLIKGNTEYIKLCLDPVTQLKALINLNTISQEKGEYSFDDFEYLIYSAVLKRNPLFIHDVFFKLD